MKTVELHPAYRLICDECGLETYVDGIRAEVCGQEIEGHETHSRVDIPDEEADFLIYHAVLYPTTVTCKHCDTTFCTEIEDDFDGN